MLPSHQSRGRPAGDDGVIQQSFANEFWILWRQGRGVEDVARDLGISDQTIYDWRHQDRNRPRT